MSAWIKQVLILVFALALVACGTDEEGQQDGDGTGVDVNASGISLFRGGSTLKTGPDETLQVTTRVRNEDGQLLAGVPVRFRIPNDSGAQYVAAEGTQTSGNNFLTNDSGAVDLLVSTSDPTNRTVEMIAIVDGTESAPLTIPINGTTLDVEAPSAVSSQTPVEVSATLTDSQGNPVADETVTFSSEQGGTFSRQTVQTDNRGRVSTEYTVTASASGSDTLTLEGAGAVTSVSLDVASEVLTFETPKQAAINGTESISVRFTDQGTPRANETVQLSSTRGSFVNTTPTTNQNGVATATWNTGGDAGPAIVTAEAAGAQAETEILLVATDPDNVDLQADPSTVGLGGQAQIRAKVTSADQPVKGSEVKFRISADTTGSTLSTSEAVSDEFGIATTTFEAGDISSATEGVEITAEVVGESIEDSVALTVGGEALSITIGTGRTVRERDETQYVKPYSVLVTDASGGAVENKTVTLEVVPVSFGKGFYRYSEEADQWVQQRQATCPNEDTNLNGSLEAGEDNDKDGSLEPGNAVTLSRQTVTTDDTGFASFDVSYLQDHAHWVTANLSASAEVAGSESKQTVQFSLPVLADHLTDENVNPPNVRSPFGVQPGCDVPQ